MGKSLVIVESPAKAKTINKYLGNDFIVKSSVGHIRDLPTSGSGKAASDPKERARQAAATRKMSAEEKEAYKKRKNQDQLIRRMGIDPNNGWEARYEVLPGKRKSLPNSKAGRESRRCLSRNGFGSRRGSHCLAPARDHWWRR
ncbi:hypothetical protein HORIV_39070 [Vreelandella olivaria]|uniref:Toprim domain-containing protein n=1 Tax=Vreelandella olivaria TaxID=390919 RepID=A0ABM7GL91_9GAMM|nr:hypothetical protein HORIV_39070 [Halomonas olivaria]